MDASGIIVDFDYETRSACDLKTRGLRNYAAHASTDILWAGYAFPGEPAEIFSPIMGEPPPRRLIEHVRNGGKIAAHNAPFEMELWHYVAARKYNWPLPTHSQWVCTMAMSLSNAYPAGLAHLGAALNVDIQKDKAGKKLIKLLSIPKDYTDDGTPIWHEDLTDMLAMGEYNRTDVETQRQCRLKLIPLSEHMSKVWVLDQRINRHGIPLDVSAIKRLIPIAEAEARRLNADIRETTGGAVASTTEVARIAAWVRVQQPDLVFESLDKASLDELIDSGSASSMVVKVLKLRQLAAKSSVAKLKRMLELVWDDGRVYHTHVFHKATTGRYGARGIQHHNFPRIDDLLPPDVALDFIANPSANHPFVGLCGGVFNAISQCLRYMVRADAW